MNIIRSPRTANRDAKRSNEAAELSSATRTPPAAGKLVLQNRQPHHSAVYRECLRNHAASLGAHALDGCGEFLPSPTASVSDPTSLKCAACGCHRNFHRRELEYQTASAAATRVIEYQPYHRHHPLPPPPPQPENLRPNSASPPPISSSNCLNAATHPPLLALYALPENKLNGTASTRKRFRTKFSPVQKEKMQKFAESIGWKMQRTDEDLVNEFCSEIGVEKGVFKVWIHNHKSQVGKKEENNAGDEADKNRNSTVISGSSSDC